MSHSLESETVSSFYYYGNNTEIAANGQLKHPELILIGDRVTIKEITPYSLKHKLLCLYPKLLSGMIVNVNKGSLFMPSTVLRLNLM